MSFKHDSNDEQNDRIPGMDCISKRLLTLVIFFSLSLILFILKMIALTFQVNMHWSAVENILGECQSPCSPNIDRQLRTIAPKKRRASKRDQQFHLMKYVTSTEQKPPFRNVFNCHELFRHVDQRGKKHLLVSSPFSSRTSLLFHT